MKIQAVLVDGNASELSELLWNLDWGSWNIEVGGTAQSGVMGLTMVRRKNPELVLVDTRLPDMSGFRMVERLREFDPRLCVVFLSERADFEDAQQAIHLGAHGYLLKSEIFTEKAANYFKELAAELLTYYVSFHQEFSRIYDGIPYSDSVMQAVRYMNFHFGDVELDIDSLAEGVGLSPSRFRTVFKEETGESPWQYLLRLRFQHAASLLLDTNLKVDDIAEKVGFSNGKYFRHAFTSRYGLTPRAFREGESLQGRASSIT